MIRVSVTGKFVNADEKADSGPLEAAWSPADHMPCAIRLRAYAPAEIRHWEITPE